MRESGVGRHPFIVTIISLILFPACGMCVGLIHSIPTCADLVKEIVQEAETVINGMAKLTSQTRQSRL